MTPQFRTHTPRHGALVAAANRPGGDLHGGTDDERNANIATLKELFYDDGSGADVDAAGAQRGADSVRLGRLTDVPFARWSMVLLPHQQVLLNVFQPQYTLMFEALLRTPKPWYYLHVLLPGGTANLDKEEYALPQGTLVELGAEDMETVEGVQEALGSDGAEADGVQRRAGTRASLCGTLMEVVDVAWQADSRLAVVVQGVCRAVVVRATQTTPYARGEVQRLPDVEQMLSALCASSAWLRRVRDWERATGCEPETGDRNSASDTGKLNSASETGKIASASEDGSLSEAPQAPSSLPASASAAALSSLSAAPGSSQAEARVMMAAAVAEDGVWQAYERERISLGRAVPPAMCTFNTSAAEACLRRAVAGVEAAVEAEVRASLVRDGGERGGDGGAGRGVEGGGGGGGGRGGGGGGGLGIGRSGYFASCAMASDAIADCFGRLDQGGHGNDGALSGEGADDGASDGIGDGVGQAAGRGAGGEVGWGVGEGASEGADGVVGGGVTGASSLLEAWCSAERAEAVAAAALDDAASLRALELRVWVALDAFLRGIARTHGNGQVVPAPKQLLGLLPPPPAIGWPVDFVLNKIVVELRALAARRRNFAFTLADAEEPDPEPYIPVYSEYPARRRAQMLSYVVWLVTAEEGSELQTVLEASSTQQRLRMAERRLKELSERLP